MPDALDEEVFLMELAAELEKEKIPQRTREDWVHEISDLITDGVALTDLGSPRHLAESLIAAAEEPTAENPELPIDFSGLFASTARERMWNPENPRILVPRSVGAGWDINMGALAVKLGILNPDDIDDDVLAAIPQPVINAARLMPAACAALSALALLRAHRAGVKLAMNTTFTGEITKFWGPRSAVVAHALLPAAAAVWAALPAQTRRDTLNKSAYASMLNSAIAGSALSSLTAKNGKVSPGVLALLAAVVPFGLEFAAVAIPIRIGRSRVIHSQR